jgi:hypothetical protein
MAVESDDVCVKVIDEACASANGFAASSNHGESGGQPIPVGDSSRLAHHMHRHLHSQEEVMAIVGSLIDHDLVAVTDFRTADIDWDPSVLVDRVPDDDDETCLEAKRHLAMMRLASKLPSIRRPRNLIMLTRTDGHAG